MHLIAAKLQIVLALPPAQKHPLRCLLGLLGHQIPGKGNSSLILINPGTGPAEHVSGTPQRLLEGAAYIF
jgi:hypothetical protein